MNFKIYEENKNIRLEIKNMINELFVENNLQYSIETISKFNNLSENNIIYIISISNIRNTGFNLLKEIRKKDMNSTVIVTTNQEYLINNFFGENLLVYSFISKNKNFKEDIKSTLLKVINTTCGKLEISFNSSINRINYNDIIYIKKEKNTNNLIIKTSNKKYKNRDTLSNVKNQLPGCFKFSSRSCLINEKKVKKIDYK